MAPQLITVNTLFYGDNLDILRQYIADNSIDLVCVDPWFNSIQYYFYNMGEVYFESGYLEYRL